MDVGHSIRKEVMFFHIHKWTLPLNGSQICEKCHKVEIIPCNHTWSSLEGNIQTCNKCGLVSRLPQEICPPHKFGPINDDKQVCSKCGEIKAIPCQHKFGPLENEKQTCIKCGQIQSDACKHVWQEMDFSYTGLVNLVNGDKRWDKRNFRLRCKVCGDQITKTM